MSPNRVSVHGKDRFDNATTQHKFNIGLYLETSVEIVFVLPSVANMAEPDSA